MAGRKTKPAVSRRTWHTARIGQAETPKSKLWAYCHWLVSAAWHADRIAETTNAVKKLIDELEDARTKGRTQ